jgi:hypothetical protein
MMWQVLGLLIRGSLFTSYDLYCIYHVAHVAHFLLHMLFDHSYAFNGIIYGNLYMECIVESLRCIDIGSQRVDISRLLMHMWQIPDSNTSV